MENERHQQTTASCLHSVTRFISTVIFVLFGFAGAFTGAITGAIAGSASHSGILRGAGVGAIAGATLSIEVLEAVTAYWALQRSGVRGSSSMADFLVSIFSGRLMDDERMPAMLTAHHWQLGVADMIYENYDVYDDIATRGLSGNLLKRLPRHVIMEDMNAVQNIYCAICLQDIKVGETARSLPQCGHMFHLTCVDRWLMRHGSCPMCRRDV